MNVFHKQAKNIPIENGEMEFATGFPRNTKTKRKPNRPVYIVLRDFEGTRRKQGRQADDGGRITGNI
ncbi:hypothetical protein RvY_11230 [Ramazzottius varieornatus]|uniref:Uncharacterized protein n=1 Tax=Ramazzottius varieornatus TaxID=947166 RepID=A0A1D1VPA4_RAMVA|nr:hypothetical protein RvY_11230 [Ramazzottius varieornatus]